MSFDSIQDGYLKRGFRYIQSGITSFIKNLFSADWDDRTGATFDDRTGATFDDRP